MAVACASVATSYWRGRCIGFTSFPMVPIQPAGRKLGLGTFYPPRVRREQAKVDDLQLQTRCRFGRSSPGCPGRQELATSLSRRFWRTFTCVSHTHYLGVPPASCSWDWPGSRRAYALSRGTFIRGFAQPNCSGCTHGRGHFVPEVVSV